MTCQPPIGTRPALGPKPRPAVERFKKLVSVQADGCWLWQGTISKDGYGHFKVGSRSDGSRQSIRAHRWSYEHFKGPVPDGLQIDHLCRNRGCCNPDHLEAITSRENTMRGENFAAAFARQTQCKRGHEFTPENTYIGSKGGRCCRACWAVYGQTKRRKAAEARA